MSSSSQLPTNPFAGLLHSVGDLAGDVIEVGELHVQLARADARLAAKRSTGPALLILFGFTALLASLPLIGLAIAGYLTEQYGWSPWKAQACCGIAMSLIATGLIAGGVIGVRSAAGTFTRSIDELSKNVAWVKSMVRTQRKSAT
jgi:uncharacterized membrane protein YphA (DoxX/SURF4 family)